MPATKGELVSAVQAEIRAEMARQNINQAELGHRLGWQPDAVSRRIKPDGARSTKLSLGDLEAIALALGRPVSAFLPNGA